MSESATPRAALLELTIARLREFWREPGAVFWTFGFPLVLAFALGLAFRSAPPAPIKVVSIATPSSLPDEGGRRALMPDLEVEAALERDPARFDTQSLARNEALLKLRRGEVDLVVERTAQGDLQYRYDETRPEGRVARLAVDDAIQRARGRLDIVTTSELRVTEPGTRYIDFLLPGLIGMNLLGSSMWGIGWVLVDARKRKLLKRYAATPMKRSDYLLSILLSRLVFLAAETVILVGIGKVAFGVDVEGSVVAVFALALIGGMSFTGFALLIAARPRSTEVASGLMNAAMMPMWLLSGTFFSAARFPSWMQPAVQALPLTALNDALRAVINEGHSFWSQGAEIGILAIWGIVPFIVGLRIFRWQ